MDSLAFSPLIVESEGVYVRIGMFKYSFLRILFPYFKRKSTGFFKSSQEGLSTCYAD